SWLHLHIQRSSNNAKELFRHELVVCVPVQQSHPYGLTQTTTAFRHSSNFDTQTAFPPPQSHDVTGPYYGSCAKAVSHRTLRLLRQSKRTCSIRWKSNQRPFRMTTSGNHRPSQSQHLVRLNPRHSVALVF